LSESALRKTFTAIRGIIWALAFIGLWTWLAISVQRYDARLGFPLPSWLQPIGFILAIVGIILATMCVATFATRGRGTPAPFDAPREFVATGPYRYVRNPMYIGAFGVLLGAGFAFSSFAIVLLAFIFVIAAHLFVLIYEESTLAEKFGESYLRYKKNVNRWWPRFGGNTSG
jgi:protein-S-isoprenylcysteine O-methyltransferase Ste14